MTRLFALALLPLLLLSSGFEWEGRLSRLRRDLESGDASRRREVVRLLATYPAREVSDALMMALADPDPGVRAEAAQAAGRVRLREAVPQLLDWLDDEDADLRASAARALGDIGDERTVPSLVRALGDSNADVRRAAVRALSSIGSADVVVPLLGRLDDSEPAVRIDAAEALGGLGDPRATVPLVGRARDDVPEVRVAVYSALGELGDARALPALLQGLRDRSAEAQLAAIASTGRVGSEVAVESLVSLLSEPDPRRSRAVVSALGAIGGRSGVRAVVDALARHETRAIAREVLLMHGRRQSRRTRRSASNTEPDEPEATIAGLLVDELRRSPGHLHATAIAGVLSSLLPVQGDARAAEVILGAMRSGRGDTATLLNALAATGSSEALVPILEHLRVDDADHSAASLSALHLFFEQHPPDGRAADPLLTALGRVPNEQRIDVVRLLGKVRAARALPALRPLLSHDDDHLRRAAVEAIGAIGDAEGADSLVPLLSDQDARTRFEAARALSEAASEETVTVLVDKLRDEAPTDRHAVVLALGGALSRLRGSEQVGAEALAAALNVLSQAAGGPDERLAAQAIDGLGRSRRPGAASSLIELLGARSPARRRAAALALGGIDTNEARAALRSALAGGDAPIRASAAAALGQNGDSSDAERLFTAAASRRFPLDAAAGFALSRLARRGQLPDDSVARLCELGASRGPFLRANVATALATLGAAPCADGPDPRDWLGNRHAVAVRTAAVRWLAHAADRGNVGDDEAAEVLERCVVADLSREVVAVCRDPSLPALDSEADVYAYDADGEELLRDELVALRLSDGTVMVARSDVNGHLRLVDAPPGPLRLEDPVSTPLEP